jgi:hypothetical protein
MNEIWIKKMNNVVEIINLVIDGTQEVQRIGVLSHK